MNGTAGLCAPLAPARIVDTRPRSGYQGEGQTLQQGGTLTVQVTGQGGMPSACVSVVVVNLTVTNPSAGSFLTVYPAGAALPDVSNLNFGPGQTIANRVVARVGIGGEISIHNQLGSADGMVDVEGSRGDRPRGARSSVPQVTILPRRRRAPGRQRLRDPEAERSIAGKPRKSPA